MSNNFLAYDSRNCSLFIVHCKLNSPISRIIRYSAIQLFIHSKINYLPTQVIPFPCKGAICSTNSIHSSAKSIKEALKPDTRLVMEGQSSFHFLQKNARKHYHIRLLAKIL